MKSKTKAQLQAELASLSENLDTIRRSAGQMRRDVFELGLSSQDRSSVIKLIDSFMNSLK